MDIAKRIIELCEERNISIYKLADLSCLTQSTVQNIISKRNNSVLVSTLEKICAGIGITMAEFFTDENKKAKSDLPFEAQQELRKFEEFLSWKYNVK